MDVIADLESYPDWTTYSSVDVLEEYEDGRPATAKFVLTSPIKDEQVMEYEWADDGLQVDWHLTQGQFTKAVHGTYELRADDSGTKVLYRLAVETGIPMIGAIRRKAEKVIIDTALKGLKERVEG